MPAKHRCKISLSALAACWILLLPMTGAATSPPQFIFPKAALGPDEVAVIVNDDDPLSRKIGEYYRERRGIPAANMIHVRFSAAAPVLSRAEFTRVKADADRKIPAAVQALVLTWATPYRVDCMSITTAFAAGFDETYCSKKCATTKTNPYFNTTSIAPYDDFELRPTMTLAGTRFEDVQALIDRGVAADASQPAGTGYLLSTGDAARNVRAEIYPAIVAKTRGWVDLRIVNQEFIRNKHDVLFYFTGRTKVPSLETLRFVPGAIADHLTSAGGKLTDSFQMSSLRWLEAGATGSYGTVVEPCNHPGKFPNPALAIFWYLQGASLIEAYWKSVSMPGEGIFIGEPLAQPYGGYTLTSQGKDWVLRTYVLQPGVYGIEGAASAVGPFQRRPGEVVIRHPGKNEIRLRNLDDAVYRVIRLR